MLHHHLRALQFKILSKNTVLTYNNVMLAISRLSTMNVVTDTKQDRINLRLKHSTKIVLERAANFEGKTVSNFILSSALAYAEKTIHEHETMSLNSQDAEAFFNALLKPVCFNQKLVATFEEHDQRVTRK